MFCGAALAFLISGYRLLVMAIFRRVIYLVAGGGRVSCAQVLRNSRLSPRLRPAARQTARAVQTYRKIPENVKF